MELSDLTLRGLNLFNNAELIPDKTFRNLLDFTARKLLNQYSTSSNDSDGADEKCSAADDAAADADDATIDGVDKGVLKEAVAALSTLFLEAAKHDVSSTEMLETLEESLERLVDDACIRSLDDRWEAVGKRLEDVKPELRSRLESIGGHFASVTEAGWKLEFVVRDNVVDRRGDVRFIVTLPSDKGEIRFAATADQLQDLVTKLKNACKGLEKVAQS